MRRTWPVCFLLLFVAGCAAYKELTPKPEVLPGERGYVELKNGDEQFTLDKEKKYYVKFPAPVRDNFVLVLRTNKQPIISSCFTAIFDDGVRPSDRIRDESAGSDTLSVYAVGTRVMTYFWVVDTVRADMRLTMHYRYMPRWRYLFEGRYAEFRETLRLNTVDRQTYESIGPGFRLDQINFPKEKGALSIKSENLNVMRGELANLESLLPPETVGSRDTAYVSYTALKSSLDDELRFQQEYAATLTFFERERTSRGNPGAFLGSAPVFADFLAQSGRIRKPIVDTGRALIIARLPEAVPYYENQLKAKNDVKRISLDQAIEPVRRMFAACEQPYPSELQSLEGYVARYNIEAGALAAARSRLGEADSILERNPSWLSDTLYAELLLRDEEGQAALVGSELDRYERQRRYPCTSMLNRELATTRAQVAYYRSIHIRSRNVARRISASDWREAEDELRALNAAPEFNELPAVRAHAGVFVTHLEAELFVRLKRETEQRVDAFVSRNVMTTENVPGLYADSVFLPLRQLTFSSAGPATVSQRNQQIGEYLAKAKTVRFPEGAIRALYADFVRNIADRGAEKAQAVAEHGRQYKGDDKQIKAYISECDPTVPKWIVRAKEYRKAYAVPVSANPGGTNEYLIRLRLNIPSDAQFPVFDVTLKLPQEVAAKAGTEQWYEEITINKRPIKNEGRFRITSPKADNNYESLISPVQMDREGSNILEVRFKYPGYRVFEISAMAQVPIIRKN